MNTYEITYLTIKEEAHDAATVAGILSEAKAKIVSVNPWGARRRLAYPIKKQDQAFFTTVVFESDPSTIQPMERALQLSDDVLRALIVLHEPGLFQRQAATQAEETGAAEAKPAPKAEAVETPPIEQKPEAPTPSEEEPKPKATRSRKKTTEESQDLDKKLDELLNEDITK